MESLNKPPNMRIKIVNPTVRVLSSGHFKQTPDEHHDTVMKHAVAKKTYINHTVRTGEQYSHEGFVNHVSAKHQKKVDGVKTDAAKARHQTTKEYTIDHINSNKEHFEGPMNMHKHLQAAKNIITNNLSHNFYTKMQCIQPYD